MASPQRAISFSAVQLGQHSTRAPDQRLIFRDLFTSQFSLRRQLGAPSIRKNIKVGSSLMDSSCIFVGVMGAQEKLAAIFFVRHEILAVDVCKLIVQPMLLKTLSHQLEMFIRGQILPVQDHLEFIFECLRHDSHHFDVKLSLYVDRNQTDEVIT